MYNTKHFPDQIFKAYDIRGLVNGELSTELAYAIGRAFVLFLKKNSQELATKKIVELTGKKIVLGYDMRPSSIIFWPWVARGIREEGLEVVDIGLVSTPLFNFACANYPEHAGGIMITASHNPGDYNGFKLTLGNGLPIGSNSGMQFIKETVKEIVQKEVVPSENKKIVPSEKFDGQQFSEKVSQDKASEKITPGNETSPAGEKVLSDYYARLFSMINTTAFKTLKIVIDAGNGMAKATFPGLIKQLPVTIDYLYLEPDGTFPNHEANPLKTETLRDLQQRVLATGADFGLALDGDCDRLGFVDERGQVVEASFVGALLGLEVLKNNPGARMFYDLRSSMIVPEVWQEHGAVAEPCMVGHALIKKMMKDRNVKMKDGNVLSNNQKKNPSATVIFASELSEHFYYHDLYDVESSELSLLYVIQLLSREQRPLSELVAPLKKYFHSGEINFKVADKEKVIRRLADSYQSIALKTLAIDGLWMQLPWGWFSVRVSNTESVLRLNLEAKIKSALEEKVDEISKIIEA